ncbi:hypothetical protein AAXB25_29080 [Paenibacillus lautus]|uniref:hypothetical protein n=1 Tax=Paenibacillus lautus TaxID=1401 RepID=UPI003D2A2CBB
MDEQTGRRTKIKAQKAVIYFTIAIVPLFIFFIVLGSIAEGTEGGAIQRIVEWLTTYILPWIYLYWFIKLVRKMK